MSDTTLKDKWHVSPDSGEEEGGKLAVEDFELDFDMDEEEEPAVDDFEDEELEEDEEIEDEEEDEEDSDSDSSSDSDEDSDDDGDEDDSGEGDDDDEPARVVDSIALKLGYFDEEDGDKIAELEDSEEGLVELTNMAIQKGLNVQFQNFLEQNPMTKQVFEYERAGGDPNKFKEVFAPEVDYSNVSIGEEDVEQQKNIVRASLKESGVGEKRIERMVNTLQDSGDLFEESQDALSELQASQEEAKNNLVENQKEQMKKQQEAAEELWGDIQTTVNENNIFGGVPLPEADKNEFLSFIGEPDEETGLTERDKRVQQMSLEETLAVDLILFHGLDKLGKLMKNRARSEESSSLKDILNSKSNKNSSDGRKGSSLKKDVDPEEIELDFG